MTAKRITVIGSVNMDLVVRAHHMPVPGENVFGTDFHTIPGGKGANQAVAVARLGAHALFIGKVGDDAFGPQLLENLRREQVDATHVTTDPDAPSGTALIVLDAQGRNGIVVCPGANGRLTPREITALTHVLRESDAVVMQLEIPLDTVAHTIRLAADLNIPVILDAGPPCREPLDEFFHVSILTPNEAEAAALTGIPVHTPEDAERAAREMLDRGASAVVLKLGEKGALLLTHDGSLHLPAHKVNVLDTTGAGDAFTAALAVHHAEGMPLREAVIMANKAGALATTKLGAQPSMPTRAELDALSKPGA